jgi:hypothetical protein
MMEAGLKTSFRCKNRLEMRQELAAKRRKSAAHGVSRGERVENHQKPQRGER